MTPVILRLIKSVMCSYPDNQVFIKVHSSDSIAVSPTPALWSKKFYVLDLPLSIEYNKNIYIWIKDED